MRRCRTVQVPTVDLSLRRQDVPSAERRDYSSRSQNVSFHAARGINHGNRLPMRHKRQAFARWQGSPDRQARFDRPSGGPVHRTSGSFRGDDVARWPKRLRTEITSGGIWLPPERSGRMTVMPRLPSFAPTVLMSLGLRPGVLERGWKVMHFQRHIGPERLATRGRRATLLPVAAALIVGGSLLWAEAAQSVTISSPAVVFRAKPPMSRQPRPASAPLRHYERDTAAAVVLLGIEAGNDSDATPPATGPDTVTPPMG